MFSAECRYPSDVWKNQIVIYYSFVMKIPELSSYMKKLSSIHNGWNRINVIQNTNNDASRNGCSSDGLLNVGKKTNLTKKHFLESLMAIEDAADRCILRMCERFARLMCGWWHQRPPACECVVATRHSLLCCSSQFILMVVGVVG